ncbi:MAG TPA: TldD/PmbA family protein [Candidatus Limnocylindria bacterium]|jgi:TldD protein|nr:TldD/PmbA family protein [Candidatus Limnocylindria bacterium]
METTPTALTAADAATAAALRDRFGFLQEVVRDMERRVPYASALVQSRRGLRLMLQDAEQSVTRADPEEGVVLTVSDGHRLQEAASDRLDPDSVRRLAKELVESAAGRGAQAGEPSFQIAVDGSGVGDFATPVIQDPASLSLADKLERFGAVRRRLRDVDARAMQAICAYSESEQRHVFVNRAGLSTQQIRRGHLGLNLFVSDGARQEHMFLIRSGTGGMEVTALTDEDLEHTASVAVELLGAVPVPPGTYDVVADNTTSGVIAHEAFGHGMETDMFLKERARAAEFIGQKIGSDLVTIVDDPRLPGAYGSYFIDDEGQPAEATEIMRHGILLRGLTDLYSATRLGLPRTANGRRESIQRKAYARMSNTFFAQGRSTVEELLSGLDGIYLCRTQNGMEDPKGWGMQIWTRYGREYRGGKPTGRIFAPVAMTGYVPDVLRNVSMVADDLRSDGGLCGKGWKELVPVSSGGPHIRTRCTLA